MKQDRGLESLKVILFMTLMLLIVEISPVMSKIFTGDLYALVGTLVFFGTFFFMYIVLEIFVHWDQTSITELGVDFDDKTISHITIGAIAGIIAAVVVIAFAYFFGGQLRPADEITTDLLLNEIIITTPTAFFEELAHRGYILPKIENILGQTNAILISSIFFSLLHFSWWATPGFPLYLIVIFSFNIFLGGVVLSLSYYWSGKKLWAPISFHFAWNMIAYMIFPNYPRVPVLQPEIFQIEWGITTIVGFFIGLSILYAFLANKRKM
ncbi:MAG: CPBP family intramembrane metalloprotease [Candidatus Thorarchaeota archaeon]|nr:CPBP family intramembrane metalloprotease [Candidatus Thorarchaeota archaeon]